jgi:mannose-6-phosphate isomerase-like protein (cupin superfamily)
MSALGREWPCLPAFNASMTTNSMSPPNFETKPSISLPGSSLLVRANEGRTLRAFGHAILVLLDGKQTDGKFTAFLNMTPPGGGPGTHYHEREDEWFYIVEGWVSFFMNGTWTDLFPGDCVYSPRGSVHGFKNNTDQPISVFINIAPAGFEHFFAEAAEEWARPERDMSRITAIAEKYGQHSVETA